MSSMPVSGASEALPAPGVAVVDDHPLVALALASLIEGTSGIRFVGHVETVSAVDTLAERPALVVLDLQLADGSEPEANVAALRRRGCQVLGFTSGENPYLARRLTASDVLGLLRKSAPPERIRATIAAAVRGESVWSDEWTVPAGADPVPGAAPLTAREQEVLGLYAAGVGAKSVARRLHISENTVNDHLRRIRKLYAQLGRPANTKVELYQRAQEDGYLRLPTG